MRDFDSVVMDASAVVTMRQRITELERKLATAEAALATMTAYRDELERACMEANADAERDLAAMTARAEKAEAEWDKWESRAEDKRLLLTAARARAERLEGLIIKSINLMPNSPASIWWQTESGLRFGSSAALAEPASGDRPED